jgi:hypothetical protein
MMILIIVMPSNKKNCSVFFADRLASDASSGAEILIGTPLRMPANPDRKSFKKIIAQVFFFF